MRNLDVAVIGGSLAGSACVRTLAKAGIDAIAFEREEFPREKVCGGFLSPGAVDVLRELELLETLRAAGAIVVRTARVRSGGREVEIRFPQPGLGISRRTLDSVLGDHESVERRDVSSAARQSDGRFRLCMSDGQEVTAKILIDAAGKLTRFAEMRTSPQFGVQFYEPHSRGDVMDFWIFDDGYGGTVGIEGNRSNSCFLIRRDALPRYLGKPDCRVTGPVAYRIRHSEFMAIGDAAGMIDPFCGEGMHHALDTGVSAAQVVVWGLSQGRSYGEMRRRYEAERNQRWGRKRALARIARFGLQYSTLRKIGFGFGLEPLVEAFWGNT